MLNCLILTMAGLFVFLAGFNVWNMLTRRGTSPRGSRIWIQVHRIAGYAFIALFAILCYCMLLRIKGVQEELPPRLILHMGLALTLAPLLFAKVIAARYQKAARELLMRLGIAIFVIAFTLVALNLPAKYLAAASPQKVPVGVSATFITVVFLSATAAFLKKNGQPKAGPSAAAAISKPVVGERSHPGAVLNLTLARIETQTPDAKTLRFLLPAGQEIAARPGQFLTFEWMVDGKPVNRSYSICSSPTQRGYLEITSKRVESGLVSQFLNDRAKVGLTVKARGPYGKFCFDEAKHDRIVLIAGGSGITPMIAMLRYIDDRCIPADVTLIYCARNEQDLFFKSEVAALHNRLIKFRSVVVLSKPNSEWAGWKGRLRCEIVEREVEKPLESAFFLCGPPGLMELGRALLKEMGIDPSRILQESFGGAVATEGPSSAAAPGPLEVRFSRSGVVYHVSADENLLESAERNGVLMPSGCRQGACGTCATQLLDGKVHMDSEEALTAELRSKGFILPCVSRPLTDLILDA